MSFEEYKKELEAVKKGEIELNPEYIRVLDEYIRCTDEVIRISGLLQKIEKIRKKYNKDKNETKLDVTNSEGRKKTVLTEDYLEYGKLVSEKNKLIPKSRQLGETLIKMQEKKHNVSVAKANAEEPALNNSQIKTETPSVTKESEEENINYNIIKSDYYKHLSPEGKLEIINKCLDELNKEGEKEKHPLSETFNGNKYKIPQKKKGIYKDLIERLKSIEKKDSQTIVNNENNNLEIEPTSIETSEIINAPVSVNTSPSFSTTRSDNDEVEYPKIEYTFNLSEEPFNSAVLADLNNYLAEKNIILKPLNKIKFRDRMKVNLNKAWLCVKNKLSLKKAKKLLPKAFDIDKYMELGATKLYGKLLDSGICIRDTGIKFKDGVSQKYNSAKSYVTAIPKRTKNYILDKYNDVKYYLEDKKMIRELKKVGITTREAMEVVYGENKDKHLDYRIVNRIAKFRDNTCQRVNSMKSKIVTVSKSVRDTIAKPFVYLRDNIRDNVRREELQSEITRIRQENLAKKRTLTNPDVSKSRRGYVGSVALITVSIIILSIIIFIGIGSLLER